MTANLLRAIFKGLPWRDNLATRDLLRAVLEATSDGIIVVGLDSEIIDYSPRAAEMWGLPPDLLRGKDAGELQRAILNKVCDPDAYQALIRESSEAPSPLRTDTVELKDGRVFDQRTQLLTIDGRPFATAFTFRDISSETASTRGLHEAEERLAAHARYDPTPLFTWQHCGDDFVLTDLNEAALRLTDGAASSLTASSARELYGDRPDIVEDFATCYRERRVIRRTMPYRLRSTNREGWFDVTFAPAPPDLVLVYAEEVTELKHAKDALIASGQLFTKVFTASPLPIVIQRVKDGYILDANEAFLSMVGYERGEVVGHTSTELGIADAADRVEALDEVQDKGIVRDVALPLRTKSGEIREVLTSLTLIKFEDESCVLSMFHDVTERNRARDDLEGTVERTLRKRNPYGLTFRELTVLHLVAAGRSDKQIAVELSISPLTVHKHVSNILAKMNASSRTDASMHAHREGLLD